ncbi:hypothetical protein PhaeoP18_00954 [Phaeobacter piscinae]|uniref:Lipoprotein n=1 Tax=Phaeobacter piscinae TaxID=1580596 RepID=A0AAN1GPV4_9RHOB|nr:hypothetical protein [Phaeobacter piscinae]ATG42919.1 hypothetical protein PhaeoP13_00969 [Phaeobacter piscinae]AUR35237.1 hypothetical protein PhaeoP18_00954 [Phaeobacter piscinae]
MIRASIISPLLLAACVQAPQTSQTPFNPNYKGVETRLLDGDLVQFRVAMTGARNGADLDNYAECAAAQYALIRGYGFARHVRTKMKQEGGVQTADAVYTISPSLPRGLRTIDAEVVVADCEANGIPTV